MIKVSVTGSDVLLSKLEALPDAVCSKVVLRVARLLQMNAKKYPKAKRVRRRDAYPETGDGFFTEKQRRWFWWKFGERIRAAGGGRVVFYVRTNNVNKNWEYKQDDARTATVFNRVAYAQFLHSPEQAKTGRARLSAMVGWKNTDEIVAQARDEIDKIANTVATEEAKKI